MSNMLQMWLMWSTSHLWTNWLTCLQNHLTLTRLDTFTSSWELFLNLLYPSMLEVEVHTYMFHVSHIESIYKWCTHFISCMNEWECCWYIHPWGCLPLYQYPFYSVVTFHALFIFEIASLRGTSDLLFL